MHQTHHHNTSPFTVVGFYPSGDGFEGTLFAQTADEAKIRIFAAERYSDDGGDLSVVYVMDETGKLLDDVPCSADVVLLSNHDAVSALVDQASSIMLQRGPDPLGADGLDCALIRAYIDFFAYVLVVAPQVFDDLTCLSLAPFADVGDMIVEFDSPSGVVFDIRPSQALAELADFVLSSTFSSAGIQVKEMVSIAGVAVDFAFQDAFADF